MSEIQIPEFSKFSKTTAEGADLTEYDWDYKYFAYNRKTGITFNIQRILIEAFQMNKKYFYLNMNFLYNEEMAFE